MIVDSTGRYVVAQLDDATLWRYDRRWRRTKTFTPTDGRPFVYCEGTDAVLLAQFLDDRVEVSVRSPADPDSVIAAGTFAGDKWSFSGDGQAFGAVPEYLLVPREERGNQLLRITDGAELDPLVGLGAVTRAIAIPDSRLVVLSGEGVISVYDPNTNIAGVRFSLSDKNADPTMRFRRDGKELWVNDVHTLLKVETADWTVLDAAGGTSEDAEEGEIPVPIISAWALSPDGSRAAVTRTDAHDIVIVNADDMTSPGSVQLPEAAIDVAWIDDKELLALTNEGKALRATTAQD